MGYKISYSPSYSPNFGLSQSFFLLHLQGRLAITKHTKLVLTKLLRLVLMKNNAKNVSIDLKTNYVNTGRKIGSIIRSAP